MRYHKIPNVALDVCTAEQKIAYNLAFRCHVSFQLTWDSFEGMETARSECLHKMIDIEMKNYKCAYTYKPGKYDEDAIFCALNAGLCNYMDHPFIANNYETIGKAFPANYL